ncbi:cytochrome C assembly family protein [Evansella tamaricis]|uniref:Cytochrome c biogenesis protein n=1 Tax=Evansella tamaricis TaxID=2069301 RepID=A0ABS6JBP2_9BACI|nr:cytochrome c biogenesis protein CcsA [Evansella tamaricis]MBU9710981.1 cytochrome c biogenesis protein [Evansella tamaricis]
MLLNFIYLSIVVFYSLSILGFFIDFIQNNQRVNRIAFWLLSIVWVLQLLFLIVRTMEYNRLPLMTIFEGMFLYSWIVVTLSLIINKFYKKDFLIFFVNLIGFGIMTISIFAPTGDVSPRLTELLILELLVIHVTLLLLSYGTFTLSFAFSMLYFIQNNMLKRKRWGKRIKRIGNLSTLGQLSYIFTLIGFPLMLLGIILGVIWAWVKFGMVPWFDVKVLSSFLVLFMYGLFLFQWVVKKKRGYSLALLNIAAFLVLLINYFLSTSFSNFHIW